MRDVAVVGFSQSDAMRREPNRNEVEILIPVIHELKEGLGITNEDIQKAKQDVNGVVGFLEKRLAAAVAGQSIAAQQFACFVIILLCCEI